MGNHRETGTVRLADDCAGNAGSRHWPVHLARLESTLMFEEILTRFEGLEISADPDSLPRVHSNLIDGYAHLPVRWTGIAAK